MSCDTLVLEEIPSPNYNWIGYSDENCNKSYRSVEICSNFVIDIHKKGINLPNLKPYIGLAGINDYEYFWNKMELDQDEDKTEGESFGLKFLSHNKKGGSLNPP